MSDTLIFLAPSFPPVPKRERAIVVVELGSKTIACLSTLFSSPIYTIELSILTPSLLPYISPFSTMRASKGFFAINVNTGLAISNSVASSCKKSGRLSKFTLEVVSSMVGWIIPLTLLTGIASIVIDGFIYNCPCELAETTTVNLPVTFMLLSSMTALLSVTVISPWSPVFSAKW